MENPEPKENNSLLKINEIPCDEDTDIKSWKPFLRQLMICCGMWVIYIMDGIVVGFPTVLIPQLRREANSTEAVSDEMSSWMSSLFAAAGIPWIFIYPPLMQVLGRKLPFMLVCLTAVSGFVVLYLSINTMQIIVGQIILGVVITADLTLLPVALSEYTSPRYRGVFLTLKSATFYWGVWLANAIGTYFHWKLISVVALVFCCYTVTVFFWPESPHWLATKGRFEECAKSHRWLKGRDKESEKELANLLSSQRDNINNSSKSTGVFSKDTLANFYKMFTVTEFYKPLILNTLLNLLYYSSGKLVCSVYAIDIIKKITNSESMAYKVMLILDGVTVFGMYIGCVLSKFFKRRSLLFVSSFLGCVFLFTISLYLYLIKWGVLEENNYVTVFLLTAFSIAISCGPLILCTTIYGELIPLRYKSASIFFSTLFSVIICTLFFKLAPSLIGAVGIQGAFLFFGILSFIVSLVLYKTLPETKDKTLQEIEEHFKQPSKAEWNQSN